MEKKKNYIINIKKLWNFEPYIKKYKKSKYTNKNSEAVHIINRMKTVSLILNKNLKKNDSILELGFGAGQSSTNFLKNGYYYTGVDISRSLVNFAKYSNKKFIKKNRASFHVGSMEDKLNFKNQVFDAVVIIGALQYVMNIKRCFKEIKRVMKPSGIFILAQTNSFAIMDIISPRNFIKFLARVIFKENFMHSYSNTFKSILLETTNLRKILNIKGNEKWLENKFLNTGQFIPWNFKAKRRILSYDRICKIVKENNFRIRQYVYGEVFFYRKKDKVSNFIFTILNFILNFLYKIKIFNFLLKRISSSNIFVLEK